MPRAQRWSDSREDARLAAPVVAIETVRERRAGAALLALAVEQEVRCVHRCAALMRIRWLRSLTLAVNLLGNGWLYLPLALGLLFLPHGTRILAAAALGAALAHVLYAPLKRRIARPRPFERDRRLTPLARVLDRYSFPSGHCMTLTAVLLPVTHVLPAAWPFAVAAVGVLAWCRLAAAHHYPSDVLAGIAVGFIVATPCTQWLLAA